MSVYFRIAATLLAVAYLYLPAVGQEKPKIYLGASSKTLGYSPLWVATKKDVTIEGRKTTSIYADQTGAKGPLPDASKYLDQSYLRVALKEIR